MDNKKGNYPKTVEEAADQLISSLSETERKELMNIPEKDLEKFHFTLGQDIRNAFGLWGHNIELFDACFDESCPGWFRHPDDASMVIITAAWKKLRNN